MQQYTQTKAQLDAMQQAAVVSREEEKIMKIDHSQNFQNLKQQVTQLNELMANKEVEVVNLRNELAQKTQDFDVLVQHYYHARGELDALLATNSGGQQEIERLKSELAGRNQEFENLMQHYSQVRTQMDEASNQSQNFSETLAQKDCQLEAMTKNLDQIKTELKISSSRIAELNATIDKQAVEQSEMASKNGQLSDEIEVGKKKYDSLRLKAHAIKEKLKKYESAPAESKTLSPSLTMNSSKETTGTNSSSSMGSADIAQQSLLEELKETKTRHVDEIANIHKSYLEQLKQYETNIELIRVENENLLELSNGNQIYLEQLKQYESNYEALEARNDQLSDELKETAARHDQATADVHKSYLEQLKQYEANTESIKNENETLANELAELSEKFNTREADQAAKAKNYDEMQKMNLKLKAKLKLMLAKEKERQHLHVDVGQDSQQLLMSAAAHSMMQMEEDRSGKNDKIV